MSDDNDGMKAIPKKRLYLFFVVDASGSMAGTKISAVNNAIREVLQDEELRKAGGSTVEIWGAVLQFSNGAKWLTPMPQPIEQITWKDIKADGGTDLGAACKELANQLDKKKFLDAPSGLCPPVILLMSEGLPDSDFEKGLEAFKNNPYYKKSVKLAAAYGDDADKDVLTEFTGSKEAVFELKTPDQIKSWFKFASLTTVTKVTDTKGEVKDPQKAAEEAVQGSWVAY